MLFRQMQYVAAVAESGSFTEAAERCFVSQSAISQQIAALEGELGVRLFVRAGRKVTPTPAGEYFYRRCRAILASVEEATAEAKRIGADSELRLDIGYLSAYEGRELQQAIVAFAGLYPEVSVSAFRGTHEELFRAVRSGAASLVVSDQRRAFSDEYENFVLARSPAYIDIADAHALARDAAVTVGALENVPCILVARKDEAETERQYYGDTLGIGRQFLFAASLDEARLMAMGGRGFLPVESVRPVAEPPLKRLEVRRDDGGAIVRTYCAFWKKSRSNYYVEEFAAQLRRHFG